MNFKTSVILFFLVLALSNCTTTYLGRYVVWNFPKTNDFKRMPYQAIKHSENEFQFVRMINDSLFKDMELSFENMKFGGDFNKYLKILKTNAFLVVHRDTIIYEQYYNGYTDSTISKSFSVTKSFLSSLIGIAIEGKFISSVDDKIMNYIPSIDSAKFEDVTIASLLNMNSGLTSANNYMPWGDLPKTYLAPNVRSLTLKNLKKLRNSGMQFEYNNYNTFLLGLILENATHMSISKFFEEYLWKRIGTAHDALFSLDSRKHKFEKVETGLAASAIDLAKFGRLYLNNGNWNNRQIVNTSWIKQSTIIDTILLQKRDYYNHRMINNNIAYHYGWWQKYDEQNNCLAFWAAGFLGQYIWIVPEKELIIVRLGKNKGGNDWIDFFLNISNTCTSNRSDH